jgi:hypothetical protein
MKIASVGLAFPMNKGLLGKNKCVASTWSAVCTRLFHTSIRSQISVCLFSFILYQILLTLLTLSEKEVAFI